MSEKCTKSELEVKSQTDWERLRNMTDDEIDYSDIPPLDDEFFANAEVWTPPGMETVALVSVDNDVLDYFKGKGKNYQKTINNVLRHYMEAQRRKGAAT